MVKILSFDPSGNFGKKEGMGTTGWAYFEDGELIHFGEIKASDYNAQESYWRDHSHMLVSYSPDVVVCESYRLFGHKSKEQHGSSLDTPQLIGYLRMIAWEHGMDFELQDPSFKTSVADDILERRGVFEKKGNRYHCLGRSTNLHQRDAIRHGIFYIRRNKIK